MSEYLLTCLKDKREGFDEICLASRWVPEGGSGVVLEVVELKNTSPFQDTGTMTRNRKGQTRRQFRIADPGPRNRVCSKAISHALAA